MDPLEQEHQDSLRRTREREARRLRWLPLTYGVGGLGLCAHLIAVDGFTSSSVALLVSMSGMLAATIALSFLPIPTPTVIEAQAPIDRGYREAPRAPVTVAPRQDRRIIQVALLVFVVACLIVTSCARQPSLVDVTIGGGTLAVTALGLVLQRLYVSWRKTRDAHLELEVDRWLAQGDAKVREARPDRA